MSTLPTGPTPLRRHLASTPARLGPLPRGKSGVYTRLPSALQGALCSRPTPLPGGELDSRCRLRFKTPGAWASATERGTQQRDIRAHGNAAGPARPPPGRPGSRGGTAGGLLTDAYRHIPLRPHGEMWARILFTVQHTRPPAHETRPRVRKCEDLAAPPLGSSLPARPPVPGGPAGRFPGRRVCVTRPGGSHCCGSRREQVTAPPRQPPPFAARSPGPAPAGASCQASRAFGCRPITQPWPLRTWASVPRSHCSW